MSCILHIETTTDVCSVAVSQDGMCLFQQEDHGGPNHAVKLGSFVDEALAFVEQRDIPLDAVAVSSGRALIQDCASGYRWLRACVMDGE